MSEASSLGITCELGQPPPSTLSLAPVLECADNPEAAVRRLERWRLHRIAGELLPWERVGKCLRFVRIGGAGIEVRQSQRSTFYAGLQTCGSVWHDPICAVKIAQKRRVEVVKAVVVARAQGLEVFHVIDTVRHDASQTLKEVLAGYSNARKLMMNRKPYKRLKNDIGLVGTMRALEVTHSWENGWHVHGHSLWFLPPGTGVGTLQEALYPMWRDGNLSAGMMAPSSERGIVVQDGTYASEYASKWGLEDEVTSAHIKKGREGHRNPWQMASDAGEGDAKSGKLFQVYGKEFKGRRQVIWSPGLRERLDLGQEQTDEQLAAEVDPDSILLGRLTMSQWRAVMKADKRGEVLETARAKGWPGVVELVAQLTGEQYVPGVPF